MGPFVQLKIQIVIINLGSHEISQIQQLVACLRRREIELYEKDLTRALSERSHVTAFDTRTYFYRIDFKGVYTPLDKETMATKQHVTLLDNLTAWLTCPEMQIIAKLLLGMRSETDLLDINNSLTHPSR